MAESRADTGERFTDEDVTKWYEKAMIERCRAESAEARCESYRSALIEIAGYRYPAPNQQAKIARAALEDVDQGPTRHRNFSSENERWHEAMESALSELDAMAMPHCARCLDAREVSLSKAVETASKVRCPSCSQSLSPGFRA